MQFIEQINTSIFKNFRAINTFDRGIYDGKITLKEANIDQSSLLVEIMSFTSKIKPQNPEKKQKNNIFLRTICAILWQRKGF